MGCAEPSLRGHSSKIKAWLWVRGETSPGLEARVVFYYKFPNSSPGAFCHYCCKLFSCLWCSKGEANKGAGLPCSQQAPPTSRSWRALGFALQRKPLTLTC